MSKFYVERHYWQRWPRVLMMCRDTGNGIERRRYVPEGGTRDEWNARTREVVRKYSEAAEKLNRRLCEESELPILQAEVDGLKTVLDDRDGLIRDLWAFGFGPNSGANSAREHVEMENRLRERIRLLGIEVDA